MAPSNDVLITKETRKVTVDHEKRGQNVGPSDNVLIAMERALLRCYLYAQLLFAIRSLTHLV